MSIDEDLLEFAFGSVVRRHLFEIFDEDDTSNGRAYMVFSDIPRNLDGEDLFARAKWRRARYELSVMDLSADHPWEVW